MDARLTLSNNQVLRNLFFAYSYFIQGLPAGFALTALVNYLTARSVSSDVVGSFIALIGLPWVFQFLWGPLVDKFSFASVKRRKKTIVCLQFLAAAASASLLLVRQPEHQVYLTAGVFLTHAFFASIQDAGIDALAIAIVPDDKRSRINAFMRGGFLLGVASGAGLLSIVMNQYDFGAAAATQTVILFLCACLTAFTPFGVSSVGDHPGIRDLSLRKIYATLIRTLLSKSSLGQFLPIVLIYLTLSLFIRSFNFYIIDVLHWTDVRLSVLQGFWTLPITITAILTAGFVADRLGHYRSLRYVLLACGLFLLIMSVGTIWYNAPAFVGSGVVIWNLFDPLISVAAFPILMALCRVEIAGSQFTAYMATINLTDISGSFLAGQLLLFVPYQAIGLCCVLMVTGIVLVLRRKR